MSDIELLKTVYTVLLHQKIILIDLKVKIKEDHPSLKMYSKQQSKEQVELEQTVVSVTSTTMLFRAYWLIYLFAVFLIFIKKESE